MGSGDGHLGAGATDSNASIARSQDRGVARRQAFLHAAREVFLEQGYEAASVNDVVRRAGGSLATLYAQFGNKEGLFFAVTQDQHERFMRAMTPESVDHLPLEQGLQSIGECFVRALLTRDNLAFFRIIIGEARKFPEQMRRYISTGGADKVIAVLANYLRAHGVMRDDPETGASCLIELWRSRHHYRALADDAYQVTDKEIAQHVARAIRLFLDGAQAR
jgi:AcrR family transcriptional regulator